MENAGKKLLISQADNYAGNFGEVLRSSAIFWVKNSEELRSTISFSNYWKYKNETEVVVVLNLRKLNGSIASRKIINFDNGNVFNYSPPDDFEGSVEVEAFSIKNMRIPYAAIMAVYESDRSISMVHAYARAYSQHEIEDKRTISVGEESCWTLRESPDTTSFAVIHNGSHKQESQKIKLAVRNWTGMEQRVEIELSELGPFETKIIEPRKYFADIVDFLEGQPGNARISFKLNGGFTRMLCGIRKIDNSQLQVTHSNFDYSEHETDKVMGEILKAYMATPNVNENFKQEIVVYPDADNGEYVLENGNEEFYFKTGEICRLISENNNGKIIKFSRTDDTLPARIVTGLRLVKKDSIIPAECSLGVIHHKRSKKHFHWMIVSRTFNSQICWVDYQDVYGECPEDAEFVFKLYRPDSKEEIVRKFLKRDLPGRNLINLVDIFKNDDLVDSFCYLSLWCSYGGLFFFSTMEKEGTITIEHSF